MKKVLLGLFVAMMLFAMCGCEDVSMQEPIKVDNETNKDNLTNSSSMFAVVEKAEYWWVLYHKETKVMYIMSYGVKNCGTIEVMVDAEGKPLLWDK